MPGTIPNCYHELVKHAVRCRNALKPNTINLIKQFGFRGAAFFPQAAVFYVADHTHRKYLYIDALCESVLGYSAAFLYEAGLDCYTGLWHKNDSSVYNEKVFPEIISFLQQRAPENYPGFLFSYNYRIMIKDGSYIPVLDRSIFYSAVNDSKLLAAVGFIINISHFKDDTKIIHTIEKIDRSFRLLSTVPVFRSVHYPDTNQGVLSKREMEILQAIYDGLSSKEIADKYFISINTVNNHRKNILHKTGTYNSNELLRYALDNSLFV